MKPAKTDSSLPVTHIPGNRTTPSLADDARAGLAQAPRSLPPKYFYDAVGAELFEDITQTPEYYPTRSELALLDAHSREILDSSGATQLIELGSGSSRKTRTLLAEAAAGTAYWPFDVSETMLLASAGQLRADFPGLAVHALVGDYTAGLAGVADALPAIGRRLVLFLGGTIGNFEPAEAERFMQGLRHVLRPGDSLLLGIDRHKDSAVLEAAYNDAAGVTAAFNRNVLRVLNRELGANFEMETWEHSAIYNSTAMQIEMYLKAKRAQSVRLPSIDLALDLAAGEQIRTEVSRKFDKARLEHLLGIAELRLQSLWTTPAPHAYSLALAQAE